MKKTIFSPRLFLFTLKLNWLPFVIVAVGTGLVGSMFGSLFYSLSYGDNVNVITISTVSFFLRMLPLAVIPLMVRVFGFYMKRCEADFFEALPYTRTQVLVSVSAATSLLVLAMLILSALTSVLVSLEALKGNIFLIGESLLMLLAYFIASLVAISATAVAVSITGHFVNATIAGFLIAFTPRSVINEISAIAESSPLLTGTTEIFKNQYNLLTSMPTELPRLSAYIYSLILAILLFALALTLFKRRRSEIATNFYANATVGHILRTSLSFSIAMAVITQLMSIGEENLFVPLIGAISSVIFLLIVHFGYELVAVKGTRAFASAAVGLPILLCVCLVTVGVGSATGAIMENRLPDADEISYVRYKEINYNDDITMADYVDRELSGVKLEEKQALDIIAKALAENDAAYRADKYEQTYYYSNEPYCEITAEIGVGRGKIVRNLFVTYEDKMALDMLLAEREDYRRIWMELPCDPYAVLHQAYYNYNSTVVLDRNEAELVYETLLSELDEIGFDSWYAANCDESAEFLTVVVRRATDAFKLRVPITPETPKAYALMNELLDEKSFEQYSGLLERIDAAMSHGDPLEFSITIQMPETYLFGWMYIENTEEGRKCGEFIKNCLTPNREGDSQIYLQLFEGDFLSYQFALSDKYTVEELKQYFDEYIID